jgi:protein-S-isoprenylcysteine O-methyltransferase Ste14
MRYVRMDQFTIRVIQALMLATNGIAMLIQEIKHRVRFGRSSFRVPDIRRPAVAVNDWIFWAAIIGWIFIGGSWMFAPGTRSALGPMAESPVPNIQYVGLLIGMFGLSLLLAGFLSLGESFRTSIDFDEDVKLITRGIYRFIRNPIALGVLLQGWGNTLMHQTWSALAVALVLQVTNMLRAHFEERFLTLKVGKPYVDYLRKTGRFLPKIPLFSKGS